MTTTFKITDHLPRTRAHTRAELEELRGTKRSLALWLWKSRPAGCTAHELVFMVWPRTKQPWTKAKTVRAHLRDLERAGLVTSTKYGPNDVRYSIAE